MTETYIVLKPIVFDRLYNVGEEITLSDDAAFGANMAQPGTLAAKGVSAEGAAMPAQTTITNQLLPWEPFAAELDIVGRIPIRVTEDGWMPPLRGGDHPDIQTMLAVVTCLIADGKPIGVLELGTAYGNGMANILEHGGEHIGHAHTVCALPEQITGELITRAFPREEIGRQLKKYETANLWFTLENTLNLSPSDFTHQYDLCIVDACHDIDYVLNDLDVCLEVLTEDGVIMLHDVYPGSQPYQALQLRAGVHGQPIIRTLPGTWWAVAAWQPGWDRLERWMGEL